MAARGLSGRAPRTSSWSIVGVAASTGPTPFRAPESGVLTPTASVTICSCMGEVSCRVFPFFEEASRIHRFQIEELTDGLGTSLEELRNPTNHCPWPDWAELCDRLEAKIGRDALGDLGGIMKDLPFSEGFMTLAQSAVSVPTLYRAITHWLAPFLFRHARFDAIVHSDLRVTVTIDIPEDLRGSEAWMRLAEGALRRLPTTVGLPAARGDAQIGSHHSRLDYSLDPMPPRLAAFGLLQRAKVAFNAGRVFDDLVLLQADLRSAFDRLAVRERDLQKLLAAMPIPLVLERDGNILFMNDAFEQVQSPEPRDFMAELEGVIEDPQLFERRTTGGTRVYERAPAVDLVFAGQPARLHLVRDVTDEKRQAERLAVTDRLAALGTLAACVGHELNNPLAYVMSSLELMKEKLTQEPATPDRDRELRAQLSVALQGLDRASVISRDLHVFARPSASERAPVDIAETIEMSLRIASSELRHIAGVRQELQPELPPVLGDSAGLGQVFVNLLVNAAHALEDSRRHGGRVVIRARGAGPRVVVEVEDNGPGIGEETLEKIFDPFFTTKGSKGTGLGLAVCRRIVQEHRGELSVQSVVGAGTCFRVELPALQPSSKRDPDKPAGTHGAPATIPLRDERVLIIDDEPTLGRLLVRMLRPRSVQFESDPHRALQRVRDEPFDVILCDLMMPGLSGPKLYEEVRKVHARLATRMAFMTGGAFTEETQAFLARVPNPQLLKPFRKADLDRVFAEISAAVPEPLEDEPG